MNCPLTFPSSTDCYFVPMPIIGIRVSKIDSMKCIEHFKAQDLDFHDVEKIWRGVLIQSVLFIGLFVTLSFFQFFTKTFPEYGIYTFYFGIATIVPSTLVLLRFHILRLRIKKEFTAINKNFVLLGQEARQIKFNMKFGIVLSDIAMLSGVAHLVMTGNLREASYIWIISLFFCLNYKPCVQYVQSNDFSANKEQIDNK
ncbi:hypothetical protein MNBD_GAMMA12-3604 [hydrothermal vent metagenome]|uniref:Uncharacterized protein n=1 Tax=hydrothermal vent metagenome TaxID=652676 RepID=A0A3B0Z3E8_9ZZZZ